MIRSLSWPWALFGIPIVVIGAVGIVELYAQRPEPNPLGLTAADCRAWFASATVPAHCTLLPDPDGVDDAYVICQVPRP